MADELPNQVLCSCEYDVTGCPLGSVYCLLPRIQMQKSVQPAQEGPET